MGKRAPQKKDVSTWAKIAAAEMATAADSAVRHFPVVGIGASAGGLEAFRRLLAHVPSDSGMAFVLVQHLDPTRASLTVDLLASYISMPIAAVEDGMPVKPNHVYVIPPNKYLTISGDKLHLTEPILRRGVRVPIDFFFHSLADDQQQRAICIVLSGSGTDGTRGVREVKDAGGLVLVEDPNTTQFDGMPRSAIATGVIDHVLPVERMPEVLCRYRQQWYTNATTAPRTVTERGQDTLQAIVALLQAHVNHDFNCYKKGTLTRRVQHRMGLLHIGSIADYLQHLCQNSAEVVALYKDFLVSVTNFFREPAAWCVLQQQVIAAIVSAKELDAPIRVWVPGCEPGEEPYSIAMLFFEQMQAAKRRCDIQIFASDIDQDALSIARGGIYPETIVADVSAERLQRFFVKGEHTFRIHQEVREVVNFAEQNLISDPPFSKLDLVSCRNLLIYLDSDAQKKVLSLFHFALQTDGYLFLGNGETIAGRHDLFQPVSQKWRIYRHVDQPRGEALAFPRSRRDPGRPVRDCPARASPPVRLSAFAQRLLVQRYCPATVLINRKAEVQFLSGPLDLYLKLPAGELAADLLSLAREGFRTKLRAAVQQAIRGEQSVTVTDARVKRGGSYYPIRITIEPIRSPKEAAGLMLVAFAEDDGRKELPVSPTCDHAAVSDAWKPTDDAACHASESAAIIRQLEDELRHTRSELQSAIEEVEHGNEEFKAAHEEVTSINEELQWANEELETSKEELQSLNEELSTVNNQLEQKVGELEVTNNDLTNLLSSTDLATVFLDRQFRIRRFTAATRRLLHVNDTDVGRPVSDITKELAYENMLSDAQQVLEELTPIAREVRSDTGDWYICRILPHRTEHNRIDGTVVTFTDISDRKRSEQRVHDARLYAEGIVETVRHPLVILGTDLRVRSCNRAFYDTFDVSPQETDGELLYKLGNGQWDVPALRTLFENMLPRDQQPAVPGEIFDYEVELDLEKIGKRTMLLTARTIDRDRQPAGLILLAIEDITERKRVVEDLRRLNEMLGERVAERARSHARLASLVASTSDAVIVLDLEGNITDWNAGAETLFGYPENEVVGRNIDILHPPDRLIEYQEVLERLGRGETVVGLETVWLSRDGRRKEVSLTVSLIKKPDGQVAGVSGILRDITDRKQLEHQLAETTDEERRRIGQELHDRVGQQISALGILAFSLQKTLEGKQSPELDCVTQIVQGIEDAKADIRKVARGLLPVEVDAEGLMNALRKLTAGAEQRFGISCLLDCQRPVRVEDNTMATQLYNIAKEAVNNAGQHSRAKQVVVSLYDGDQITLLVRDDGVGLPTDPLTDDGSGLRIMRYRASLIGATFSVTAGTAGGTLVTCSVPNKPCHDEG